MSFLLLLEIAVVVYYICQPVKITIAILCNLCVSVGFWQSLNVLDEAWKDGECGGCRKVAYIVWKDKKLLVAALKKKGYSISDSATSSLEDMNRSVSSVRK